MIPPQQEPEHFGGSCTHSSTPDAMASSTVLPVTEAMKRLEMWKKGYSGVISQNLHTPKPVSAPPLNAATLPYFSSFSLAQCDQLYPKPAKPEPKRLGARQPTTSVIRADFGRSTDLRPPDSSRRRGCK
jgi:hypothetical protein